MMNPYAEQTAQLEKMRQRQRDELLDNGMNLTREHFRPFLPDDVKKVRVTPGEDAERILLVAKLAAREVEFNEETIDEWVEEHEWRKTYVLDKTRSKTKDVANLDATIIKYALLDKYGYLYYYQNELGKPSLLPDYLGLDIGPLQQEISSLFALMTASKNEEMITRTLETPVQAPYPTYQHPTQQVPLKEVEQL